MCEIYKVTGTSLSGHFSYCSIIIDSWVFSSSCFVSETGEKLNKLLCCTLELCLWEVDDGNIAEKYYFKNQCYFLVWEFKCDLYTEIIMNKKITIINGKSWIFWTGKFPVPRKNIKVIGLQFWTNYQCPYSLKHTIQYFVTFGQCLQILKLILCRYRKYIHNYEKCYDISNIVF